MSAWFSIWRMRSRVTWKAAPTSSSVHGSKPPMPKRISSTRRSRKLSTPRISESVSRRILRVASSSAVGVVTSAMKCPSCESSSSPTGFSSEIGVCAARMICSTSSTGSSTRSAISAVVGSRASSVRELALDAPDAVELLDDVHRHADRAALVGERASDRLADPPGGVGRELVAAAVVELLDRAHEADRALLDQVEERQPLLAVVLGDRDDEADVGLDHVALGAQVAALDALGELDLLRRGEQLGAADVAQEALQRIAREHLDRVHRLVVVVGVRLGVGVGLRLDLVLVLDLVDRAQRERGDVERLVIVERGENALVQVHGRGECAHARRGSRLGARSPSRDCRAWRKPGRSVSRRPSARCARSGRSARSDRARRPARYSSLACASRPIHESSSPKWKRGLGAPGRLCMSCAEAADGLRGHVLVEAEHDHRDLRVDVGRVERERALADTRARVRDCELQRIRVVELRLQRARRGRRPRAHLRQRAAARGAS